MKKTFIFIVLVLMGVSGFVYASNQSTEVSLGEGWNLVYGFTSPDRIESGSEIEAKNIKAVYLLMQPSKEYVRLHPNPESDKLEGIQDSYYEQTAQWVYSDKEGMMKYGAEEPLPLGENKLFSGWNLVGLVPEMGFGDPSMAINHFSGTCNIEKAFFFNSVEWYQLDLEEDDIADDAPYLGIAVKVTNDCNLGTPTGNTDGPPGLPGGDSNTCTDSDNGIDYGVKGETAGPFKDLITNEERDEMVIDSCLFGEYLSGSDRDYYVEAGVLTQSQAENENVLIEYYCTDDYISLNNYECPNGCSDGACI